ELPAQAVIHSQPRIDAPVVLGKESQHRGPDMPVGAGFRQQECGRGAGGSSAQEIGQTIEGDAALYKGGLIRVPSEALRRASKLHRVGAACPSEIIVILEGSLSLE